MGIKQSTLWLARILLPITAMAIAGCSDSSDGPELVPDTPAATNILFLVMDDIGIDQLEVLGFGGKTPPATPTIAALAGAGVSFTDAWSMPACSPTRGVMYEALSSAHQCEGSAGRQRSLQFHDLTLCHDDSKIAGGTGL